MRKLTNIWAQATKVRNWPTPESQLVRHPAAGDCMKHESFSMPLVGWALLLINFCQSLMKPSQANHKTESISNAHKRYTEACRPSGNIPFRIGNSASCIRR